MEEWREISGYEGFYEISDLGSVKSLPRTSYYLWRGEKRLMTTKGRILKPAKNSAGYFGVALCRDGKCIWFSIHKLVAKTFLVKTDADFVVCHNDGDTSNNSLLNLRYDTQKENCKDTIRHNRDSSADRSGASYLSSEQVLNLVKDYLEIKSVSEIAMKYRIPHRTAHNILSGCTWSRVTGIKESVIFKRASR